MSVNKFLILILQVIVICLYNGLNTNLDQGLTTFSFLRIGGVTYNVQEDSSSCCSCCPRLCRYLRRVFCCVTSAEDNSDAIGDMGPSGEYSGKSVELPTVSGSVDNNGSGFFDDSGSESELQFPESSSPTTSEPTKNPFSGESSSNDSSN